MLAHVSASISDPRYRKLCGLLRQMREEAGLSQVELARRLRKPQSYVSKYESAERRLDVLEVWLVCEAMGVRFMHFARRYESELR